MLAKLVIGSSEDYKGLSISNEKLGDVFMVFGRPNDALNYHKTALEINERLAVGDPNNAQAQSDVGYGFVKLGQVMSMQAQYDDATKYHRRAFDLRLNLASKNPDSAGTKTEAYRSHYLVGEAMLSDAEYPDAQLESYSVAEIKHHLKDYIWLCDNADNTTNDIEFVMAQEPKLLPRIMRVRIQSLIESTKSEEAYQSAARFAGWTKEQSANPGENRYHAGSLYALCITKDQSNLEQSVTATIEKLREGE
jgi:tetratricopeptide (TPR) repeat protein